MYTHLRRFLCMIGAPGKVNDIELEEKRLDNFTNV
jgi:hypothetical protein